MSQSVFISGSIAIKTLPAKVKESILKIMEQNMTILVGDASGIDTLIQDLCNVQSYTNLIVYTITPLPRYLSNQSSNFRHIFVDSDIKKERERQTHKDKAMSDDSTFSLVIWDGHSKGSYANIKRAIEQSKKVKVFYSKINDFIQNDKVTLIEIKYLYHENNGYTATEVIKHLQENGIEAYKRSQDLNKFLLDEGLLNKEGTVYKPTNKNPDLFIVETYRGKAKGVKFNNKFIDWIEQNTQKQQLYTDSLF